jgi:Ca-activated chloride channel family protein
VLRLTWVNQELVHLIWVVLAFTIAIFWLERRGRDRLDALLSRVMQRRLTAQTSSSMRILRLVLIGSTLVLGVLAMMRPQLPGGSETISASKQSADIMVVLDVSKSMLAEDAAPNRLQRAKAELSAMVERLKGHRIGLVAFAGRAAVLVPLTPDYGFFRMILRGTNTKSVSRGGTRIGDALRKAIAAFDPGKGAKMIILITDGEDHESFPEEAANEALEAGIQVVTVGFGSEEGSQITITDPDTGAKSVLTDRSGNVVTSRLDGELLRKIAELTEAPYIPAGVAALDLESIIDEHIEPMVQANARAQVRAVPREIYTWFILAALLCVIGAVWASRVTRRFS